MGLIVGVEHQLHSCCNMVDLADCKDDTQNLVILNLCHRWVSFISHHVSTHSLIHLFIHSFIQYSAISSRFMTSLFHPS